MREFSILPVAEGPKPPGGPKIDSEPAAMNTNLAQRRSYDLADV